jgi:hypothetical protein
MLKADEFEEAASGEGSREEDGNEHDGEHEVHRGTGQRNEAVFFI